MSVSVVEDRTVQRPAMQDVLAAFRVPELSMHWVKVCTAHLRHSFITDPENADPIGNRREQLVVISLDQSFHLPSDDVSTRYAPQHLVSDKATKMPRDASSTAVKGKE